jgi:hypothetical protein
MYVEERIYRLKIGAVAEYCKNYEENGMKVQLKHLPHMVGYYFTEVGGLNTMVHLWAYDSLDQREKCRAAMQADPEWKKYLEKSRPLMETQETRIMKAAPFLRGAPQEDAGSSEVKPHPQVAALLEAAARSPLPTLDKVPPFIARRLYAERCKVVAPKTVPETQTRVLLTPAVALRSYRPAKVDKNEVLPALVFFHGGGWTIGDLDTPRHAVPRARQWCALRGVLGRVPSRAGIAFSRRGRRLHRGDAVRFQ